MSQLKQWLNPRTSAAKMAVLFVIVSLAYYLTIKWTGQWLPLVPDRVIHSLTLWQFVTYATIFSPSPMSFIFGVLILVSIGGALEQQWGAKRLWIFAFAITTLSGAIAVAASLFLPFLGVIPFLGADIVVSSFWVAYGLMMGRNKTNFWGLPVTGNTLALIGASFVLLSVVLSRSWEPFIPELAGLALAFVHVKFGFPGHQWLRFNSWRLHRDLQKRSQHLKVIGGDGRNTPRDSDKYLH